MSGPRDLWPAAADSRQLTTDKMPDRVSYESVFPNPCQSVCIRVPSVSHFTACLSALTAALIREKAFSKFSMEVA